MTVEQLVDGLGIRFDPARYPREAVRINVEFTDLLVRRAVTQGQVVAEAENLRTPNPPDFGSRARPGFCSHCHFRLNEPWISLDMPGDFHRDVVARREARTRAGGGGGR